MFLRITWILLAITISACSATPALLEVSPVVSGNQDIVAIEDLRILRSSREGVTVWAWVDENRDRRNNRLVIDLSLENRAPDSIDILPGRFIARDGSGGPVKVLSESEFLAATGRKSSSGSTSPEIGSSLPSASVGIHTGNTGEEIYSGEMRQAEIQRGRNAQDPDQANAINPYWTNDTVQPGQSRAGTICLQLTATQAAGSTFVLDVPVAGNTHSFQFAVNMASNSQ